MKLLNINYNRLLLVFVLLLTIFSCRKPERKIDFQGHRGARGLYPENSLAGFEYALSLEKVTTLELDLVVSSDRKLIISHEPWMSSSICTVDSLLTHVNTKAYNLFAMTQDSIKGYDCGSKGNEQFPHQKTLVTHKPAFSELLDLMAIKNEWPNLNIETKSKPSGDNVFHPRPKDFAAIIANELSLAHGQFPEADIYNKITVQSFDIRTLRELRKLHLGIKLCLLTENETDPAAAMDRLGFPADIYSPNYQTVTPDIVNWCHFRRISIIPWTVNELEDMQSLLDMGVDGIISDYPNKFDELVF